MKQLSELGKFDIVLLDPPWSYTGQQDKWGAAAKFYKTMLDEELKNFDIKQVLNPKSIVFIWATGPRLDFAIELGKSWGLHYRGMAFVWVKTKQDGTPIKAQGVRPSIIKPLTEYVLSFSTVKEGRPLKLHDESIVQTIFEEEVIYSPKEEHSRKPKKVQESIDQMYPNNSKVELFAREQYKDWVCWGDEL